jgi:hypothetical protein
MGRMKFIDNVTYDNHAHRNITLAKLNEENFDSVYGNVHGRPELIIYEPDRIKKFIVCFHANDLIERFLFSETSQLY